MRRLSRRDLSVKQVFLPLLVLANLAYFPKDFIGWIITLTFFLLAPGYLLLCHIRHEIKSAWLICVFSLALSILVMMVGGLLLNTLYVFGLKEPLTTFNVFATLDVILLFLIATNRNKSIKPPKINVHRTKEYWSFALVATLLPVLTVFGDIRLNNGASNILTMVVFALIPLMFLYLLWRNNLSPIYPYAIVMFALSILFSNSLRGWYITGHDIHREFLVFQAASQNGYWSIAKHSGNPYNACLSITILPTVIDKITNIPAVYVFKAVFQTIFAFGVTSVYFLARKLSDPRKALMSAFVFISFPTFLDDMPFLNRQEIAFIFFGLLILTSFLDMARRPKRILTVTFLLGLILSHYSSSYVTVELLLLSWVVYKLLSRKQKVKIDKTLPVLSLPIICAAILFTFLWNAQITVTTAGLRKTIISTVDGIFDNSGTRDGFVQYAIFAPSSSQNVQQQFNKYVGKQNIGQANYVPDQIMSLTGIGRTLNHIVNVDSLNNAVHSYIAKIFQVLLLIGVGIIVFVKRKTASHEYLYYYSLCIACLGLLVLWTLLPQLSVDYTVIRLFQQTLVVVALVMVIAAEFIFSLFKRYKTYLASLLLALLFWDLSGFIPQALGGYLPQLPLNNAGQYYDFYYTQASDVESVSWLDKNISKNSAAFMDTTASSPPTSFPVNDQISSNNSDYIFEGYTNVHRGVYRVFINGGMIEYTDPSMTSNRDLLYSNQGSKIYSKDL